KTGTEQAFNASFATMWGNVSLLMNTIGMAVVFAILLVTANAMMMSARERTGEVAVLKTIGFSDRRLVGLVMLEAGGIALVVAVFIGMLALANGFRTALVRTGSDRNVLVLRRGADSELSSGLSREAASILAAAPHIATGADGKPLVSPEVYVIVPLPKIFDTTQVANVVARGVGDQAWTVRSNVRVLEGRKPETGRSEICVGRRLVARFPHTGIGETMRFAGRDWTVVCHFAAGGSAFESEVWGENEQFMPVFRGQVFQSVTLRLSDPGAFEDAKRLLEGDK